MEQWSQGQFTSESTEGTAQMNAKALGAVQLIEELLETDYERISEAT